MEHNCHFFFLSQIAKKCERYKSNKAQGPRARARFTNVHPMPDIKDIGDAIAQLVQLRPV